MNYNKKGIRVLAFAESFDISEKYSTLVGIIMRKDFIIDGVTIGGITVRGNDSTYVIINLINNLARNDINCIFIDGIIVSMYNIIDGSKIFRNTGIPLIALTFENPKKDIHETLKKYFPYDYESRISKYDKIGKRHIIKLKTNKVVYSKNWGINSDDASNLINSFIIQGSIPEPIRIAKLCAKAFLKYQQILKK
ncbi:MAG: DUF99 family protein [Nitrososphaeraceae archaeon]